MTEKQEGANELLLHDKQGGGGRKQKWHVLHHLFTQRLYSTIHSYLASLANCKPLDDAFAFVLWALVEHPAEFEYLHPISSHSNDRSSAEGRPLLMHP